MKAKKSTPSGKKPVFITRDPVEIFCLEKYKGYHIRGHIYPIKDELEMETEKGQHGENIYHLKTLFLLNDDFFSNNPFQDTANSSEFGAIIDKTPDDLKGRLATEAKGLVEDLSIKLKKSGINHYRKLLRGNPPLIFTRADQLILETPYLLAAVEEKRNAILVSVNITLEKAVHPQKYPNNPHERVYSILAHHYSDCGKRINNDVYDQLLSELCDMFYFNYGHRHMEPADYRQIISAIANLAWDIAKDSFSASSIKILSHIQQKVKDRTLPLNNFCNIFFDQLLSDLETRKLVFHCKHCGDICKYTRAQKYCSLPINGKDCGTKARNKRFYSKHKKTLLPKSNQRTRALRTFYKDRGTHK